MPNYTHRRNAHLFYKVYKLYFFYPTQRESEGDIEDFLKASLMAEEKVIVTFERSVVINDVVTLT